MLCEILDEICVLRLKELCDIRGCVWIRMRYWFFRNSGCKFILVGDLDLWVVGIGKIICLVWESKGENNYRDREVDVFLFLKVVWDFFNSKKMM